MPTIDSQQQSILRRRQLAQALQQMSMEPLQAPGVPGAKISPWEGINKLAQSLSGNLQNRSLDKEQAALSGKQDNERLAQALAMSNSVVPPSPGPVTPSPVEGQPVPELSPQAPAPVQPPPGLEDARQRTVKALAQALSSSDPQMAKVGEMMAQGYISGSESDKDRIAKMAESLSNRQFNAEQNKLQEAGQNQRLDKTLAQQMEIQNLPARPREAQLLTPEEEAQQLRLHPPPVPAQKNIDPLSPEGIAATIKIRAAEAKLKPDSEMNPETLDALVAAGKTNPETLKKLSAKDYAAVTARIQQTGGVPPDRMKVLQEGMRDNALESAKWLKDNFQSGAVGAKGPTSGFGLLEKPAAGTAARDFTDKFDTFKNQIVLPNLDMLHGLGRVTDREFQALSKSINAIDRSMSESQFKTELNTVIQTLGKMKGTDATIPQTPSAAAVPSVGGTFNGEKVLKVERVQ